MTTPRRVLIVEDEWLIARDHVSALTSVGHIVVGPVATVTKAIALLDTEQVDIGLLDFQLVSETSAPIAQRLAQHGIPFIVVTGHSDADFSPEFATGLILAKPSTPEQLLSAVERVYTAPSLARRPI